MARGDVRIAVTLACEECKRRNYQTNKSKRNNPDRITLQKYCPLVPPAYRPPRDPLGSLAMARDRQRAKQRRKRRAAPLPSGGNRARTARDIGLDDSTVEDAGARRRPVDAATR